MAGTMTRTIPVVAGIVRYKDKFLLLKRVPNRNYEPSKWGNVYGYFHEFESAEEALLREMFEEVSLHGKIVKSGENKVVAYGIHWHRFVNLVDADNDKVRLDRKEHSEYKWVSIKEIKDFDLVEGVEGDYESVGLSIK